MIKIEIEGIEDFLAFIEIIKGQSPELIEIAKITTELKEATEKFENVVKTNEP